MKKAYSPVKISLKGNMDHEGKIRFQVENRHLFSNLAECRITWEAGGQEGNITGDIAPRSAGELEITLPESLRHTEMLNLTVTGVRGFEIDRYCFRILPENNESQSPKHPAGKLTCQESKDLIRINAGKYQFEISKRNGLLTAAHQGKSVLNQSPSLMVLPLNGEGEGIQMTGKTRLLRHSIRSVKTGWRNQ